MRTFTQLFLLAALLLSSNANAQYCMLPGRTPYVSYQPGISNFKLNTINRTSLPVESITLSTVVVSTGDTTTLVRGHTYTVSITHTRDSINFPTVRNNIRVWIDYNHNMDFTDAGETAVTADHQTYGVFTANFTVPATATLGTTMLRATAKMSDDGGHTLPTSCDSPADPIGYHGEMEDYYVTIIDATSSVSEVNANPLSVSVYPNPAGNQVEVSVNADKNMPVSIDIYDITGRLAGNLLKENTASATLYKFDLSKYPPGMYFIKALSGDACSSQKLIKIN